MTLVELMVVLSIIALLAGVSSLAFQASGPEPRDAAMRREVTAARRASLADGRPRTVLVRDDRGGTWVVTLRPDGSVLADPSLGLDRLTGRWSHAAP